MLPLVVGALSTIPNATKEGLKEMKFSKTEINKLLIKLQNNSVRWTVKICKTFMTFSELMHGTYVAEYYAADSLLCSDRLDNDEEMLSRRFFKVIRLTLGMQLFTW